MRVKICGLQSPADIEIVNRCRPDLVGFVFAPSRRQVSVAQAYALRSALDPEIAVVGVFVDQPLNTVCELVQNRVIDQIQLHGGEDANYVAALRRRCCAPIIRCVRPEQHAALPVDGDMLLFDSGAGSGNPFDWHLLADVKQPFFLAGGLTPENVATAIHRTRPYGVDVSSGVEVDGHKDEQKVAAFIAAARGEQQ